MIQVVGIEDLLEYFSVLDQQLVDSVQLAGESAVTDLAQRVHKDGRATDGSLFSPYSTKAYFTSIDSFPNRGRIPANLISKNGRWVQLPQGYSDFRKFASRSNPDSKKNFRLTGHLQTSIRLRLDGAGISVGFLGDGAAPDDSGITAAQKAAWLEGQEGKDIWSFSEEEIGEFLKDVIFEWQSRTA